VIIRSLRVRFVFGYRRCSRAEERLSHTILGQSDEIRKTAPRQLKITTSQNYEKPERSRMMLLTVPSMPMCIIIFIDSRSHLEMTVELSMATHNRIQNSPKLNSCPLQFLLQFQRLSRTSGYHHHQWVEGL
jgi:hypothetical protein